MEIIEIVLSSLENTKVFNFNSILSVIPLLKAGKIDTISNIVFEV